MMSADKKIVLFVNLVKYLPRIATKNEKNHEK